MAGADDWRFKKAQELGLIDTGPVIPAARKAAPLPPKAPTPAPGVAPARAAPAPAHSRQRSTTDALRWLVPGLAVALLLAAACGWWLRGVLMRPDPAMLAPAAVVVPAPAALPPVPDQGVRPPNVPPPVDAVAPEPAPAPIAPRAAAKASPPAAEPAPRVIIRPPDAPAFTVPASEVEPGTPPPTAPAGRPDPPAQAMATALPAGDAPSFDCRRARAAVDRMMCTDPDLGRLDQHLADAYRAARQRGADERQLDREQAAFLNARAACRDARCIDRVTSRRIKRLEAD